MRTLSGLMLPWVLLLAACAPPQRAARGPLDLSDAPEPGAHAQPSLGPVPHTGGGRMGVP